MSAAYHLALVTVGIVTALAALRWYSRVRGGAVYLVLLLALATVLVLAGFGVIGFPGLPSDAPTVS